MALVKTVGGTRYGATSRAQSSSPSSLSRLLASYSQFGLTSPATQPAQPLPYLGGNEAVQKLGLGSFSTSPAYIDTAKLRSQVYGGTPGTASSGLAASAAAMGIDYSADPVLQKIRAMDAQIRADAQAQAQAQTKQSLIQYGYDPNLDQSGDVAKLFPDQATMQAAQQNPFSTLAQLAYGRTQTENALENALNASNLYFGSYRGEQLGKLGHDYQQALAQAGNQRASGLSTIQQALAQAYMNADIADMNAEQDAYNRALQWALTYGTGGAGATASPIQPIIPGQIIPNPLGSAGQAPRAYIPTPYRR